MDLTFCFFFLSRPFFYVTAMLFLFLGISRDWRKVAPAVKNKITGNKQIEVELDQDLYPEFLAEMTPVRIRKHCLNPPERAALRSRVTNSDRNIQRARI